MQSVALGQGNRRHLELHRLCNRGCTGDELQVWKKLIYHYRKPPHGFLHDITPACPKKT